VAGNDEFGEGERGEGVEVAYMAPTINKVLIKPTGSSGGYNPDMETEVTFNSTNTKTIEAEIISQYENPDPGSCLVENGAVKCVPSTSGDIIRVRIKVFNSDGSQVSESESPWCNIN